jgi:hypothetical protein
LPSAANPVISGTTPVASTGVITDITNFTAGKSAWTSKSWL